jgi:phospholipase D1/2
MRVSPLPFNPHDGSFTNLVPSVRNFEAYDSFTPNLKKDKEHKQGHIYDKSMKPEHIKKQLDRVKGHLVWMPLDFLCEAEMAEKGLQVNAYTESVYT